MILLRGPQVVADRDPSSDTVELKVVADRAATSDTVERFPSGR